MKDKEQSGLAAIANIVIVVGSIIIMHLSNRKVKRDDNNTRKTLREEEFEDWKRKEEWKRDNLPATGNRDKRLQHKED